MKLPISWLKDFIDLDGLTVEDVARKLTLAGMEVDEIHYVGLPMPDYSKGEKHEFKTTGISWQPDKLVVAEIREVMPHPNADRLTLCDLYDGTEQGFFANFRMSHFRNIFFCDFNLFIKVFRLV